MNVKTTCLNSKGEKLKLNVYNVSGENEIRKFVDPYKLVSYKSIESKVSK